MTSNVKEIVFSDEDKAVDVNPPVEGEKAFTTEGEECTGTCVEKPGPK
ncbi:hypothetical protein LWC34_30650 [Kibdelosporangium philippinense]|uniref:FxLD family lantipeptide n=1 Tax=Kibdelosporangium philippinense TaxID=211113 RepID=A0ABS8ZH55_9PSEU|nr:hypothetical protein [Kibdelosporangium philippinense]MCE7007146.1 hypothetical protein [Kibdelosporangium philippinense]